MVPFSDFNAHNCLILSIIIRKAAVLPDETAYSKEPDGPVRRLQRIFCEQEMAFGVMVTAADHK